jgi:cob(I)alamin adenosyltransferase
MKVASAISQQCIDHETKPFGNMSIVTKTGDQGTTGLMYNRRVSKNDPRVEAYGAVDELNAAIGLARATAGQKFVQESLLSLQNHLVILMGELATTLEDLPRYAKDGYSLVTTGMTTKVEEVIKTIESQNITYKGWATPGATLHAAALDLARTTCRRAERRVCELQKAGYLQNGEIIVYLNRVSDLFWLLARWVEQKGKGKPSPPS